MKKKRGNTWNSSGSIRLKDVKVEEKKMEYHNLSRPIGVGSEAHSKDTSNWNPIAYITSE